jgi:hypothetical protein
MLDLRQVLLIEQRQLQVSSGGRLLDLRALSAVIQRTPSSLSRSSRMRAEVSMPRSPHHFLEPEALPQFADLRGHGFRIPGVALEYLYRHRTTLVIGQQPEDDW